jgi:phage terminase large subunit
MELTTTSVYEKIGKAWLNKKRHIWLEGGTSASKTYSVLQFLILLARYSKTPITISIVSESLPHLKRGCLRDFFAILVESPNNNPHYNMSDHIYDFGKNRVEFFPADEPAKLRGGRRDVLFVNEINNIGYDAYRELDSRTRLCTIGDWNPTCEFFLHENGLLSTEDAHYIHATYLDALNVIPPEVIKNILDMGRRDPNWENIYIKGRIGKVEGLVYPYFDQVDILPKGDEFYGLDFGYSTDPTVLTRHVILEDRLYSEELIYEAGLTNQAIAHRLDEVGVKRNYAEIYADSSEPKSIQEIANFGFNVKPCKKGADSVEYGHQKLRQHKQFWVKSSLNCIKEQRNYRYIADKDGKLTDKTTHQYSHGMDSRRYAVVGKLDTPQFYIY